MQLFDLYARYYDLFYRDKDYDKEVLFVRSLIESHYPSAHSIIELGCGTGRHAILLAESGYEVTAVDRSEEMLSKARLRGASSSRVSFVTGDIRTFSPGTTFDVCVSLFHVMSYMNDNASLAAVFQKASEHLVPGGVFIFDCWYGPGVLADPPVTRVKRLEDNEITVTRIAEPVMHPNDNMVEVNYEVLISAKETKQLQVFHETHKMRYLFLPEISMLAENAGMAVERVCEWMSGRELPDFSWYACFILRKTRSEQVFSAAGQGGL